MPPATWAYALLLSALFGISTAAAQTLPPVAEFYFDNDVAAVSVKLVPAETDELVGTLMRHRERGRRAVEANLQLADIAIAEGRNELAMTLYAEAIDAASAGSQLSRRVQWNAGWGMWRIGEPEKALDAWLRSLRDSRLSPSWAPPTLAMVLWELGRQQDAVAWYAAAVRTEPADWSDADNHARLLPDWKPRELGLLAQVHQAWQAAPPAWP